MQTALTWSVKNISSVTFVVSHWFCFYFFVGKEETGGPQTKARRRVCSLWDLPADFGADQIGLKQREVGDEAEGGHGWAAQTERQIYWCWEECRNLYIDPALIMQNYSVKYECCDIRVKTLPAECNTADREASSEGATKAVEFPECTAQCTNTSSPETGSISTRAKHMSS